MRIKFLLMSLTFVMLSLGIAHGQSFSLDHVDGLHAPDTILVGEEVTFYIRVTTDDVAHQGITNGFRVYSPDGAEWGATVGDTIPLGWKAWFDLVFAINPFSADGMGADTIGFGGARLFAAGIPPGIDAVGYTLTIGPIDPSFHGKTIVLDSSYYRPTGTWKWAGPDAFPAWDGPHTFTVYDPNAQPETILGLDPDTLSFTVTEGLDPASQTFDVVLVSGDPASYTSTETSSWMTLTDPDGTAPGTVTVNIQSASLAPDTYFDSIQVNSATASNTPLYEYVRLVVEAVNVIQIQPDTLRFSMTEGGAAPDAQMFTVSEQSGRSISYESSTTAPWIGLTDPNGTTPGQVTVAVDPTGLTPGTYFDSVEVTSADASNSPIFEYVEFTISAIPRELVVTPTQLSFIAQAGGANPEGQVIYVSESHGFQVPYTSSVYHGFTQLTDPNGTTPDSIIVNVDISGLVAGDYYDTVLVSSPEATPAYSVQVHIEIWEPAQFVITPDTLKFTAVEGDTQALPGQFNLTTTDQTELGYNATENSSWVAITSNASGMTPADIGIEVDPTGVTAGIYLDSILIEELPPPLQKDADQADPVYAYVMLTVTEVPLARLQVIHNAADPAAAVVDVWVNGDLFIDDFAFRTAVPFTDVPAGTDLNVGIAGPGSSSQDDTLASFVFNLNVGESYVLIANGVLTPGDFVPNPDGITIAFDLYPLAGARESATNPGQVDIVTFHGVTDVPSVDVYARMVATLALGLSYSDFSSYASIPAANHIIDVYDSLSTLASFQADLSGLGGNSAVVFASGFARPEDNQGGASMGLFAALANGTVIEFPMLEYTLEAIPTELTFEAFEGSTALLNEAVVVTADGGVEIPFDASVLTAWTSIDPTSGMTTDSVIVTVDPTGLTVGVYSDSLLLSSPQATNEVIVPITLSIVPPPTEGDTVSVATVPAVPGAQVVVAVELTNAVCEVLELNVDLGWTGNNLILDSASFAGSRSNLINTADIDNDADYVLVSGVQDDTESIAPGTGNLVNLHFTVMPECEAGFYEINLYNSGLDPNPRYLRQCGEDVEVIEPVFFSGGIVVDTSANYVCGYVVDTAGNPVAGATVELWNDFPGGMVDMSTTSAGTGVFAFANFTTIPFDLYAYKDGYYPGKIENLNFGQSGIMIVLTPYNEVTPTPEWVDFYCDENTYMGVPLPIGSVVDAYDPDGVRCGTYFVTETGKYGFLHVYRDDPFTTEDEGAEPDNVIRFFVNGIEAMPSAVPTWTANGDNFQICLEVMNEITHVCSLREGWNLVSWPLDTDTDDIMDVLASIHDKIEVVLGFEHGGLTYDPILPMFSDLWMVDHLSGYWVKVTEPVDLEITGIPVPVTTPIPVSKGWNLVSYLPESPLDPMTALETIHDDLIVALGYDSVAMTYIPGQDPFNDLDFMSQCFGYWVKVSQAGTLIYPTDGPLPAPQFFAGKSDYIEMAASADGVVKTTRWINLYSEKLALNDRTVKAGSEIAAYSEAGIKVGSFVMEQDGLFGFMPIYGDDPTTDQTEGLSHGNSFYLTVDGVRAEESFTWTNNGDRVKVGALTAKAGSDDQELPTTFGLKQNYPNPFNPTTTISFTLPVAGKAKVQIFNLLGEIVAIPFDGTAQAGETVLEWDGRNSAGQAVSSGIYFYRLSADNYTETKKMTLLK